MRSRPDDGGGVFAAGGLILSVLPSMPRVRGILCGTLLVALSPSASVFPQEHPGVKPYDLVCRFCHGPEGRGDQAPPLVPLAYDVEHVLTIVREGYGEMPPISTRELGDEQVRQVVEYLELLTHDPRREETGAAMDVPLAILHAVFERY